MEKMIKYKEDLGQSRGFEEEKYRLHIYTNAHTNKGIWQHLKNTKEHLSHHKMNIKQWNVLDREKGQ